jgi:hypothetical protein
LEHAEPGSGWKLAFLFALGADDHLTGLVRLIINQSPAVGANAFIKGRDEVCWQRRGPFKIVGGF